MFVEHIHKGADRVLRIIAVHQVDVCMIGAQPFQLLVELFGKTLGIAVGGVGALGDHHHFIPHAPGFHPLTHQAGFHFAIPERGVEGISAMFEVVIKHGLGVRGGDLIVHAHHQPGHRLVQELDLSGLH